MGEWDDIGSGLQARKADGAVEVRTSDPKGESGGMIVRGA